MENGLICKLIQKNGDTILELFDANLDGGVAQTGTLFTELPEDIASAIGNKELMAQLGENILIRLAVTNGIQL